MDSSSIGALSLDAVALANQLRHILLQITRQMRREARSHGISPTQVSLLAAIGRSPEITLSELASREGMTAPSVSGHMNRLEAAGFIARSRALGEDRRRIDVVVTEAGTAILLAVRAQRTAWLVQQLEMLTEPERAIIQAAIAPLGKLVQA